VVVITVTHHTTGGTARTTVATVARPTTAAATTDDHMRWFTTFVAGLLGDFGRYLARGGIGTDGVKGVGGRKEREGERRWKRVCGISCGRVVDG